MNYYPNNFYQNYPYNNNAYQQQAQQTQMGVLQGKVVDSIDMVKANEVPFGSFGIFPRGDLSEIYVKAWNNNGTTQINTYRIVPKEETQENATTDKHNDLLEKITALNEKLDMLLNKQDAVKSKEKEVNKVNAY